MATEKSEKKRTVLTPDMSGTMKNVCGSECDDFNKWLLNQVINAQWAKFLPEEDRNTLYTSAGYALVGIAPKDETEGMLAAQMIACHSAAMECYRRAMLPDQTFEGRQQNLAFANKLSRTYTMQLDALQRYRGKGQQKVTVEHVHVHQGGKAIIGNVTPATGGGVTEKTKEQPHAKQVDYQPPIHAPLPPLPCANEERERVPVTGNAKR